MWKTTSNLNIEKKWSENEFDDAYNNSSIHSPAILNTFWFYTKHTQACLRFQNLSVYVNIFFIVVYISEARSDTGAE